MTDVLTLGETMAALRTGTPLRLGGTLSLSVAGAESDVAIGLARLGHAARWIGAVGADEYGALVLRTLRAEGVAVDGVRVDPTRTTGLLTIERRFQDVSRVIYHRAGSAGASLTPDDVDLSGRPRWLHLTGITPALSASAAATVLAALDAARAAGVRVCLDVNHRTRLWSSADAAGFLRPLAGRIDVVVASEDEVALIAPAAATTEESRVAALLGGGVAEVALKRGGDGASSYTADGVTHRPAVPVRVLDTVGAGDAFTAGLLSGHLDSLDADARLERAVACAAFAVASAGDWEGAPTRAELALLHVGAGQTQR